MFFPNSPILQVEGTFGECTLLETLILSVLNYDSAVASAASRMASAAEIVLAWIWADAALTSGPPWPPLELP